MRGISILLVLFIAFIIADISGVNCSGSKKKPKPKPCKYWCGYGAFCKNGECVCRSKRIGKPNFVCYSPRFFYLCKIFADPTLDTFNGESGGIKMPAALALTELTTRRFGRGRGVCKFAINGWTERFNGKYFIEGLQFTLIQQKRNGQPVEGTYRIISKAMGDSYNWTLYEKNLNIWDEEIVMNEKSKRFDITVDGCKIRLIRLRSNFLFVNIMCCSIRFAIRPHNPLKPDIVPGFWIMLRRWAQMRSLPQCLCNNVTNSPTLDELKNEYGFKSRTQYTTFTGLAYGRPLQYPGVYEDLPALQNTLTSCVKIVAGNFMKNSEFLFRYAKLIDCEQDRIMNITYDIAKGFCNGDGAACSKAVTALQTDCPNIEPNDQMKALFQNGCV